MVDLESKAWCTLLGVPENASPIEVCAGFERTAPALLAPLELTAFPVYSVATSTLPPRFQVASRGCDGWFSARGYFWLKPHLPVDRGPGFALIVVDGYTIEDAESWARGAVAVYAAKGEVVSVEEMLEYVSSVFSIARLCRILTHECAHAIDSLNSGEFCDWMEALGGWKPAEQAAANYFDRNAERLLNFPPADKPDPISHGLRFTRILAHLDFRLRRAGVHAGRMVTSRNYGLAPYADCYEALSTEPAKFGNRSFADILARPMPPAFAACDPHAAKCRRVDSLESIRV